MAPPPPPHPICLVLVPMQDNVTHPGRPAEPQHMLQGMELALPTSFPVGEGSWNSQTATKESMVQVVCAVHRQGVQVPMLTHPSHCSKRCVCSQVSYTTSSRSKHGSHT